MAPVYPVFFLLADMFNCILILSGRHHQMGAFLKRNTFIKGEKMTDHVKIYGVKPRIQYTADGTLTEYEFPFAIFTTSDIDVYFGDTKQETTGYTVSEARHSDGGTVTFETAPASGTIITIVRNLSIERTSDFQEGSTLRAKVLNDELDYQIACAQQIAENLNRSMVLPPYATDNDLDLTLPTPSAGKAIVWNSDGTNLENSTVAVNALESTLKGYKETAESAASAATTKAGIASDKADIATQKAQIATDKAAEATSTLASKANKDMDNLSDTGKDKVISLKDIDYNSGISITSGTTAQTAGIFFYQCAFSSGLYSVSINSETVWSAYSGGGLLFPTIVLPIAKGDIITFTTSSDQPIHKFFPIKGANNA